MNCICLKCGEAMNRSKDEEKWSGFKVIELWRCMVCGFGQAYFPRRNGEEPMLTWWVPSDKRLNGPAGWRSRESMRIVPPVDVLPVFAWEEEV
jgi:hypothetical protein